MSAGIAEMIAAISRGYRMENEGCEPVYATWLGDRLRVDSLPIDIPAEQVDIDESLLERSERISITIPDELTGHGNVEISEGEVRIAARLKAGDRVFAIKTGNGNRYAVIGIYR